MFGAMGVPVQVRVIAAAAWRYSCCDWTDAVAPPVLFSLPGLLAVAGEVLIGLALGFVLQLAFAGPVMAAEEIAGGMGLSMAMTAILMARRRSARSASSSHRADCDLPRGWRPSAVAARCWWKAIGVPAGRDLAGR